MNVHSEQSDLPSAPYGQNGQNTSTEKVFWISLAAAFVIGLGSVLPAPWTFLATLTALVIPGLTATGLLLGFARIGRITVSVLAIAVSLAVIIAVSLLLDVSGISLDRHSITGSLCLFELITALMSGIAWRKQLEAQRKKEDSADTPTRKPRVSWSLDLNDQMAWVWVCVAVALGIGLIVSGVAIVHSIAPTRHDPRFTSISFHGSIAPAASIRSLKPGPIVLELNVSGNAPVSGVLAPYVDGKEAGAPVRIRIESPRTVSVVATIPPLNQCENQLSIVFTPADKSPALRVSRYVTGEVPGNCTDFG